MLTDLLCRSRSWIPQKVEQTSPATWNAASAVPCRPAAPVPVHYRSKRLGLKVDWVGEGLQLGFPLQGPVDAPVDPRGDDISYYSFILILILIYLDTFSVLCSKI